MPFSDISIIYSTFPHRDEALSVARILVEKRLVACANLLDGMTSIYRWEGKLQEGTEVVLIVKTRTHLREAVTLEIKRLHSYAVPCVVVLPVTGGLPEFLQWVVRETT